MDISKLKSPCFDEIKLMYGSKRLSEEVHYRYHGFHICYYGSEKYDPETVISVSATNAFTKSEKPLTFKLHPFECEKQEKRLVLNRQCALYVRRESDGWYIHTIHIHCHRLQLLPQKNLELPKPEAKRFRVTCPMPSAQEYSCHIDFFTSQRPTPVSFEDHEIRFVEEAKSFNTFLTVQRKNLPTFGFVEFTLRTSGGEVVAYATQYYQIRNKRNTCVVNFEGTNHKLRMVKIEDGTKQSGFVCWFEAEKEEFLRASQTWIV